MAGRKAKSDGNPETPADDEGFLGRWSRRKAEAKTSEQAASPRPENLDETDPPDLALDAAETDEPPAFDVSTLPDIDSLGQSSDFSPFMQVGVPPAPKTKALRKLWRVKPELANLDGLVDYGEDLTGSFKVVDHLKTAYEVGRGFLRDQDDDATESEKPGAEDLVEGGADLSEAPAIAESRQTDEGRDDAESLSTEGETIGKA